MRLHSWLVQVSLVGVLLLICLIVLLIEPDNNINKETFRHIRAGMTRQEVSALLGVPPGQYTSFLARNQQYVFLDGFAESLEA